MNLGTTPFIPPVSLGIVSKDREGDDVLEGVLLLFVGVYLGEYGGFVSVVTELECEFDSDCQFEDHAVVFDCCSVNDAVVDDDSVVSSEKLPNCNDNSAPELSHFPMFKYCFGLAPGVSMATGDRPT